MDPLAQLFERFRMRGDLRALGKVFDELAPRLLPIALHLCGAADAEDVLQQTFLLAIERADSFDATRRLEPWLAGLLTNIARNARRDAQRRRAEAIPEIAAGDEGPADAAQREELVAHLRTHVDALPHEQRQVLLLQLQHAMSPAEIAEVLAVPPGTVRMRIHRGLQALRRLLPAGLAALVLGALPARGLAAVRTAVRTAVLRAGALRAPAAAAGAVGAWTLFGSYLAMKKLLIAVAAVLAVGLLWWNVAAPAAPIPERSTPAANALPAVADARRVPPTRTDEPAAAADPLPRTVVTGALRIRVLATTEADVELPRPGTFVVAWSGGSAVEPFDGSALRCNTDDHGEVLLSTLEPGTWHALVPADRGDARAIVVTAGEEALLEFREPARAVLRGIVVDADGVPVAGAELWIRRGNFMGRYRLPEPREIACRRAGTSGADGRFTVATADSQEGSIAASHAGYGESFGRYVNSTRGELCLVLARASATVAGTVRDSRGAPVADALVELAPSGQDSRRAADGTLLAARVPGQANTDAAGRFGFAGLAPGKVRIWVTAYPLNPAWPEVEVAAGAHAEVDIELPDGVTVVGTVRQTDGTPARAYVESRSDRGTNGHYSECDVRPDGTFLLQYQPRRSFVVVVSCGRADVAARQIDDPAPGILRCDFVLDEPSLLRGHVVDDGGRPLPSWVVTAVTTDGRGAATTTGENGAFQLAVPADAPVTVEARPRNTQRAAVTRASVRAGETLELRVPPMVMLPSATVRGRVVTADGAPAAKRSLKLACARRASELGAVTAADGTFAFDAGAGGHFELAHEHGGNSTALCAAFELADGEQRDLGDLALPAVATLIADLVHADGTPWTAELVGLELRDAAGQPVDVDHSTAGGRLSVTAPPGTYRVAINATDLIAAPQRVTLTAGTETTVRIALAIGRTRRLTFNGDGKEHPTVGTTLHVTVRTADGTIEVQQDVTGLYPDLRGFRYWYRNHVFAFGSYSVEAHTDGELRYRGSFAVGEDLEAPTTVDVPRVQ